MFISHLERSLLGGPVSFWAGSGEEFRSSATYRLTMTKAELEPQGIGSLMLAVPATCTSQTFFLLQQP